MPIRYSPLWRSSTIFNRSATPNEPALSEGIGGPSLRRVAVIGAGRPGRLLADLCSNAGYSIILEDVLPSRLRAASWHFDAPSQIAPTAHAVEYATTIEEAVREADLVIDCVPDELESKLEILTLIDRMAPPRTIIATPTRTLSIADLASCTYRPERCVALELPPELLAGDASRAAGLVRIIRTTTTDEAIVHALTAFWQDLGYLTEVAFDPGPRS